jgi:hypothetical protein
VSNTKQPPPRTTTMHEPPSRHFRVLVEDFFGDGEKVEECNCGCEWPCPNAPEETP